MEHLINFIKSLLIVLLLSSSVKAKDIEFSIFELTTIAQKIYYNECSSRLDYLVYWNKSENFASIGIGHFIWYPQGINKKFDESFPKLLTYMKYHGVTLPKWLKDIPANPWRSRQEMEKDPRSQELREFLQQTISIQALFMAKRINEALPKILESVDESRHQKIQMMFDAVAKSDEGYYLLIDYVNFKGEGVKKSERYNGHGWGLLQVLECMDDTTHPKQEVAKCPKKVLPQRVNNAPKQRNETKWLKGWFTRIATYTDGDN
jgi:hypothetical protein